MTWERFSYICRKAHYSHNRETPLAKHLAQIEREAACRFYGEAIKKKHLAKTLLEKLGLLTQKEDAANALAIYSHITLPQQLTESIQLKRMTIYLSYITLIFWIISGIYQVQVAPTFVETLNSFDLPVPEGLLFYSEYSFYVVLIISVLLIGSLVVGFTLKSILYFEKDIKHSLIYRFLIFNDIKQSYSNILEAIMFPLHATPTEGTPQKMTITHHLSTVNASTMPMAPEIEAIVRTNMQHLVHRCEAQMRLMSVVTAVIIVSAIFFFLSSAYSPIFTLGDIV